MINPFSAIEVIQKYLIPTSWVCNHMIIFSLMSLSHWVIDSWLKYQMKRLRDNCISGMCESARKDVCCENLLHSFFFSCFQQNQELKRMCITYTPLNMARARKDVSLTGCSSSFKGVKLNYTFSISSYVRQVTCSVFSTASRPGMSIGYSRIKVVLQSHCHGCHLDFLGHALWTSLSKLYKSGLDFFLLLSLMGLPAELEVCKNNNPNRQM